MKAIGGLQRVLSEHKIANWIIMKVMGLFSPTSRSNTLKKIVVLSHCQWIKLITV